MRAHVGDQLVVGTDRIGVVVGVPAEDGSPPYIIKWLKDGHIAMVLPDQYSRIVPAGQPVNGGSEPVNGGSEPANGGSEPVNGGSEPASACRQREKAT